MNLKENVVGIAYKRYLETFISQLLVLFIQVSALMRKAKGF